MITKFDIGQQVYIDRGNPYFIEGTISSIEIDRDKETYYWISFGTKEKPAGTKTHEENVYASKEDMLQSSSWQVQTELSY